MATIGDIRMYYSGGNPAPSDYDNYRQYLSLGGVISSDAYSVVHSQTYSVATITGLTIHEAYGNPIADTTLYFISGTPNQYQWGTTLPVDIPGAGLYTLGNFTDGQIYVECDGAFPGANTNEAISIGRDRHRMFDIQNPLQAFFGETDYRCFYLKNTSTATAIEAQIWVENQAAVGTTLELGLDPAGIGNGTTTGVATTISEVRNAPAGVSFSAAPLNSPLIIGTMSSGEVQAVWVKRVLTPEITDLVFFNTADIGIGALI